MTLPLNDPQLLKNKAYINGQWRDADDGALLNVTNPATGDAAKPMELGVWYEVWTVVNNAPLDQGGQTYDLYVRGGEFTKQQKVFTDAVFRMQREAPLTTFMTICNTGSKRAPYGNGGVGYDDIYMTSGRTLSSPISRR